MGGSGPPARAMTACVDRSGRITGAGTGADATTALGRHPALVDYAIALLGGEATSARFFYKGEGRSLIKVSLQRDDDGERALVSLAVSALPAGLTARELDVLSILVGGLSNRQIAERLVTSVRTVSTHVEHILAKLGQETRAGAAAVAAERGWVLLPVPGGVALPPDLSVGALQALAGGGSVADTPTSPRRPPRRRRTLVIGSAFPLSGPAAADGLEMLNGSALAVAELNSRGGITGRRIEQLVVDADIFSVDGVQRALETLVAAGVDAITSGYVFIEDPAREVAADYGAPYLHSMTSESQARIVSDNHELYRSIFQVCPTERYYASGFVRFLADLEASGSWTPHARRLAFLETALPSGQMLNELAVEAAHRAGYCISAETVAPLGADWGAVVDSLERTDPAAVMVTQFLASELAAFQREIARRAPHVLVYGVYAPSVPEFLDLAGPAAEGMCWATVTGTYSDTIGAQFRQSYERAWGRPAGRSNAGIAYDEIHLLAQAWCTVAEPSDFRSVADQLRRVRYRGVNGAYYLDNPGQCGLVFPDATPDPSLAQAHLVFQIQGGAHRIVAPAPYADATFRWAPLSRLTAD